MRNNNRTGGGGGGGRVPACARRPVVNHTVRGIRPSSPTRRTRRVYAPRRFTIAPCADGGRCDFTNPTPDRTAAGDMGNYPMDRSSVWAAVIFFTVHYQLLPAQLCQVRFFIRLRYTRTPTKSIGKLLAMFSRSDKLH